MIRKNSYVLDIPRNIKVSIKNTTQVIILIKSKLGLARIAICLPIRLYLKKRQLHWSRLRGKSNRAESYNVSLNNNLKKQLQNVINFLNKPDKSHFRLVGRGYKIINSKTMRSFALELGYSNKKIIPLPSCVNLRILNRYNFELHCLDNSLLRVLSKRVRELRLPNPYTSKGIFLDNERIIQKQGKSVQY